MRRSVIYHLIRRNQNLDRAWRAARLKRYADLPDSGYKQRDFKPGMKVRYIGKRVAYHIGRVAEVRGKRGGNGLWLRFSDGTIGSAIASLLEPVKNGAKK